VAPRVRDRALTEASSSEVGPDGPPIDPSAVGRAYERARARRRAREQHERAAKYAGIRFWLVLLALLAVSAFLAVSFWREVQQLFGL
jgi:RNase P protein component